MSFRMEIETNYDLFIFFPQISFKYYIIWFSLYSVWSHADVLFLKNTL
jgi:hypothetical protein